MSKFDIRFVPALPNAPPATTAASPERYNWKTMAELMPQEFDIEYRLGQSIVAYYPSSIANVLADLMEERELLRSRQSHVIRLSGYPVLDVCVSGEVALFYYPHERSLGKDKKPIERAFDIIEVEREFDAAIDATWAVIEEAFRDRN